MTFWLKELERAEKEEGDWVKKGKRIVKRYKDDREARNQEAARFNILWSNTETLRPALISATPVPEARPRYKKKDPVARIASKILERGLEFSLDQYDFVKVGRKLANDFLLPGRAVPRVRYIPTIEKKEQRIPLKMVEKAGETHFVNGNERVNDVDFDENGDPFTLGTVEEVVFEEVITERVPWQWFRMEPADSWSNVNWIAFGAPYTVDEGVAEWGETFRDASPEETDGEKGEALKNKIIVWEIWDKRQRKQIFVAKGLDEPLEENDDPLKLENFYPTPEPAYAVEDNDTMIPTPEFCLWQDQADELDRLTERIRKITDAIRARGAYAGEEQHSLTNILEADDNTLIHIEDWVAFIDKGGLDGIISWVPIDVFAKVLQILEAQRAIKVQEIFELTGVSDILRGATDPRETAAAQKIKERSGSRRLLTKQDTMQRLFRDIYRIKAEIIAENFDEATLRNMVGLENTNNQLFSDAVKMIKSDVLRAFNIDLETDSTIAADEQKEKEGLAEAMQAVSAYAGSMLPLVQAGFPMPVAMELLRDYLRKFRFGRKLDDLMDEFAQQQPANPQAEEQKAEQQKMEQEMQQKQQEFQMEMQKKQEEFQLDMQKKMEELGFQREEHSQEIRHKEEAHRQDLRHEEEMADTKVENTKELGEAQVDVKRRQAQVNQSKVQE